MKKDMTLSVIVLNIIFMLFFMSGYHILFGKNDDQKVQVLRENTSYEFINPILECNVDFEYYNPKKLQEQLAAYIESTIAKTPVTQISYYARLLNNGATFGYEENREFTPASLIKLPLAIAFLKHMSFSSLKEKTTITQAPDEILERNFWEDFIEVWKQYSFQQLFEAMLKKSDNTAALALINFLWVDPIYRVYREFGLENLDFSDLWSVEISSKAYASFFRMLYNASYIPREDSEFLLSLMTQWDFKTGIAELLPKWVKVANKFWERKNPLNSETQLHDCGIIYAKENPYVLCVMTKGGEFDAQLESIQTISKMIYESIVSL